jgi:hypothetical protein
MMEYQDEVHKWMLACFGAAIAADAVERNHRFLEEALELVQAGGCSKGEALALVDYVFDRPVGKLTQEVGGVVVTLAALCTAHGVNTRDAAWSELDRVWENLDKIRAKHAAQPKHVHSPLPGPDLYDLPQASDHG